MKLTTKEIAKYLRVSKRRLLGIVKENKIPFMTIGRRGDRYFDPKQVMRRLEKKAR